MENYYQPAPQYQQQATAQNMPRSPRQTVFEVLSDGKILAIAIFLSIMFLFGLIQKLTTGSGILGTIASVGQMLDISGELSEVFGAFEKIETLLKVADVMSLLPLVALTVAFWLMFANKNVPDPAKRITLVRVAMIISVIYLINAASNASTVVIFMVILMVITFAVEAGVGLLVMLVAATYGILIGVFYFRFIKMAINASKAVKSDENVLYVYKYVFVMLIIIGIFTGLSALITPFIGMIGSALSFGLIGGAWTTYFLSLIVSTLQKLVYIFVAILFNKYKALMGEQSQQEIAARIEEYKALKVTPEGRAELLRRKQEKQAAKAAQAQAPYAQSPAAPYGQTYQSPAYQAPTYQAPAYNAPAKPYYSAPAYNAPQPEFESTLLKLFSDDFTAVDKRFSVIGSKHYSFEASSPAVITDATVLKDSLSGRTLLRLKAVNRAAVKIKGVAVSVENKANDGAPCGIIKNAFYDIGVVEDGQSCLECFALVLPNGTTNGSIRLNKVVFEDGLFWDGYQTGNAAGYNFITEEKLDYDIELYSRMNNR